MEQKFLNKGQISVITAPSGTGKTTIIRKVREILQGLGYSISHTTRPPREGETNGREYYFVDSSEFKRMIEAGEFLEWVEMYGELYGTSFSSIEREFSTGNDLLLDLDCQGAKSIKEKFPESILIFILPPSLETLRERIKKRGSDNRKEIKIRMHKASDEIRECRGYDYIVFNNDLDQASKELVSIITAQRASTERRFPLVKQTFQIPPDRNEKD